MHRFQKVKGLFCFAVCDLGIPDKLSVLKGSLFSKMQANICNKPV